MLSKNNSITQRSVKGTSFIRKLVKRAPLSMFALSVVLLQTACVSNISSQVKEAEKDASGAFDGVWTVQVKRSAMQQHMPGNWIANCNGKPTKFAVRVKNGIASVRHGGKVEETFVAGNGNFRFHIPLKQKAKSSTGSDLEMTLTGINRIIYGNFEKTKGIYTFGYEDFGNSGCTAMMDLVRKT